MLPHFSSHAVKEGRLFSPPLISENGNTGILQEVYPFMIFCFLKAWEELCGFDKPPVQFQAFWICSFL